MWLGYNKITGIISIQDTFNQDTLEGSYGLIPLLGIDIWEHAYYLQYKNNKKEYLNNIWNIINWKNVNMRYINAKN